jgi:DNA-binding NtrC family response regulator
MNEHITHKLLVLIVNSDPIESEELVHILEPAYSPMVLYSGEEALSMFDIIHLKTSIVLISSRLSDMDGTTLLKKLKEVSMIPAFIMISDNDDIVGAVNSIKAGAFDYITPPLNKNLILHTISQAQSSLDGIKQLQEITQDTFLKQFGIDLITRKIDNPLQNNFANDQIVRFEDILNLISAKDADSQEKFELIKNQLISITKTEEILPKKPTILVVEDNDDARENINLFLEKHYITLLAADGKEAEALAAAHPEILVVLLDVYLPDVNGLDLMPNLIKSLPKSEFIIITAFKEINIAVKALRNGACDYINKPFYKADILSTLTKTLQRQYILTIIPKLEEYTSEPLLSYKARLSLLENLIENLKLKNKPLKMKDIYSFFPDLKKVKIPDDVHVPKHVLEDGILEFLEELQNQSN